MSGAGAASGVIDPRIGARRAEVQRDQVKRRWRRTGVALAGLAALAGLWGLTRTPLLDVDHVAVGGAARTGAAAVRDASGIGEDDRLVTLPLGRIAQRVSALPWVATAEVTRDWPGTVRITVVERRAVVAVPAQVQGWVLLDVTGRQLAHVPGPPPDVVRVEAEPVPASPGATAPRALAQVLAAAASVPEPLRDRVVGLRPVATGELEGVVLAADGHEVQVRLGRVRSPSKTWLALATVLDDADLAGVTTVDLRVPTAPVLVRR